jgi:hypothetical protein
MVALIRKEPLDVTSRLSELRLSFDGLSEVLRLVFAECGFCNENDPSGTRGWTVYRWGVRGLREQFRPKGWDIDRTGNLETIVNHDIKVRVAVLNTDDGTCDEYRLPRNTNEKGPNSERAALANAALLPGAAEWPRLRSDGTPAVTPEYDTWHLCIYVRDDELRAELSLLNDFCAGYFCSAAERIFLVRPGEWRSVVEKAPSEEIDVVDFAIERK